MIQRARELQPGVSVVIPCYNEEGAIARTVEQIAAVLDEAARDPDHPFESEMILVNDGSRDATLEIANGLTEAHPRLRVVDNQMNCGYGASIKRGIAQARYDRIVITDADGTYPNERIAEFARRLDDCDMVVGARTGADAKIPLIRRPAKWALLKYARWMSRADIKDINSGLRAFWTVHADTFWFMLPDLFSFTTTLTLAMHVHRLRVIYLPIEYHRRVGSSSIRPIRDTLLFFSLVLRTVMYFKPLGVFGTIGLAQVALAITVGVAGKLLTGQVPDVMTVSLFSTGVIFCGLGLLGDHINAHRAR